MLDFAGNLLDEVVFGNADPLAFFHLAQAAALVSLLIPAWLRFLNKQEIEYVCLGLLVVKAHDALCLVESCARALPSEYFGVEGSREVNGCVVEHELLLLDTNHVLHATLLEDAADAFGVARSHKDDLNLVC